VSPPVNKGGQGGGLGEQFVEGPRVQRFIIDTRRRRVDSNFRSRHDEREQGKTKKGRNKGSTRGKLRCETRKFRKPYSSVKPRNRGTKKMQRKIRNKEI